LKSACSLAPVTGTGDASRHLVTHRLEVMRHQQGRNEERFDLIRGTWPAGCRHRRVNRCLGGRGGSGANPGSSTPVIVESSLSLAFAEAIVCCVRCRTS